MDYAILMRIFITLNYLHLVSISRVCSSWNAACCNPTHGKKLDLIVPRLFCCLDMPTSL
ncbi:hypothetical protein C1H46_002755 [Malus baccata]|uniref:F-box domain-containing protein n=1 Tax=Malus baccata TaxID=106549 RepID=A0A540NL10_MALBA|nr:hypothetical protein C1H46_002755 [Malus baccata]